MNLAQAKGKQVHLIVKSMLSNNITWKSFSDFKEPLRSQLKAVYKQDNCIVVVVVREDADDENLVYAVGVMKLPGGKKENASSDYGSDEDTDGETDEDTDFDIGVMVVGVSPSENTGDDTDDDIPDDTDDDVDDDAHDVADNDVDDDDDSDSDNDDDDDEDGANDDANYETFDESDDDADEDIGDVVKGGAHGKPKVATRKKVPNAKFFIFSSR